MRGRSRYRLTFTSTARHRLTFRTAAAAAATAAAAAAALAAAATASGFKFKKISQLTSLIIRALYSRDLLVLSSCGVKNINKYGNSVEINLKKAKK